MARWGVGEKGRELYWQRLVKHFRILTYTLVRAAAYITKSTHTDTHTIQYSGVTVTVQGHLRLAYTHSRTERLIVLTPC